MPSSKIVCCCPAVRSRAAIILFLNSGTRPLTWLTTCVILRLEQKEQFTIPQPSCQLKPWFPVIDGQAERKGKSL